VKINIDLSNCFARCISLLFLAQYQPQRSEQVMNLHVICERDAGLFSLIQQVIANIPWAIQEGRLPVVYFQGKTC